MKNMKRVLCWMLVAAMMFGVIPFASFAAESDAEEIVGRETVSLNDGWLFTDNEGNSETVNVPHSWGDYPAQVVRTCTYEKIIDVSAYEGKELFLYFEAVAKICTVYVDDIEVGTHKGGYYSFAIDITEACAGKDTVKVKVEATNQDSITIPMFSDFVFFGGMYRDAWLVAVDPAAYITNEDHGSNGIYVLPEVDLETGAATVNTTVMVTNEEETVVAVEILDAEGNVVGSAEKTVEAGYVQEVVMDEIVIENAHLWQGTFDPYLYTVKATVSVNGEELDCVKDEIGLRTFEVVDGEFLLNGEVYEVRGVGLHQDGDSYTYATSDEDKLNDLEMIQEMGANALRTAHYPHDDLVYQWADENGFVIWNEIPNFGAMIKGDEFFNGVKYNTVEMVKQGYNHPSIIIWGIENELNSYADTVPGSPSAEELGVMFNELGELCLSLDPSRMIGEAQIDQTPKAHETATWSGEDSTFDVVGFNIYTGWYSNVRGATKENKINRIVKSMQNKVLAYEEIFAEASNGKLSYLMTEYGAGSNINQHDDLGADFNWGGTDTSGTKGYYALGAYQPEEYANYVHEGAIMALYGDETNNIEAVDGLWGSFIWAMFDFASYRTEGGMVGVNTKGMVTMDRETKKDVFYLYKANWNKDDLFTYITSRRFEARATETIDVKVYSNCDSVELIVDGKSYGNGTLEQDCVFVWSGIQLKKNETVKVEAIGTKDGEVVYTDTIDTWYWSIAAEIKSDSDLNKVYDGEPVAEPEYTVTVEGEDITDKAEVTIEWYQVVEGADDDSENPGYDGGTPDYNTGYDTGYNPGYEDGSNPGYDTGYNPGYDTGYNPGYGNNIGYGDLKLDGAPTEVGKYYCLIIVSGTESYLGNTLRIDFEITAPYAGCDGTDCPSMAFTDLAAKFAEEGYDTWWHPYTDFVIENGLMIGMETDVFDLDTDTTRAMVTMVLWRLAGSPETEYVAGTYTDVVAEQWFAEPIAWATKVGVLEGYGDGLVGPDDVMKREDIVNMFYRYWQYIEGGNPGYYSDTGYDTGYGDGENPGYEDGENPGYEQGVLDGFVDAADISDYAVDAMIWAVENGLILGYENNTLLPQGAVDRSELAAFLMRWCVDIAPSDDLPYYP